MPINFSHHMKKKVIKTKILRVQISHDVYIYLCEKCKVMLNRNLTEKKSK